MPFLKWYNQRIEDTMLTGPDKVVVVFLLFLATALFLALAALFLYLMPGFASGEYVFLFATIPQRVGFAAGFVVLLFLGAALFLYTAVKLIKKETI